MWSYKEPAAGSAWDQQQSLQAQQPAKLLGSQSFNGTSQQQQWQQQQQQWQQPFHQQDRPAASGWPGPGMQLAPLQPCWPGQQQQQQQGAHYMANTPQQLQQQCMNFPASLPPLPCMPGLMEREQQQQLPQLIETGAPLSATRITSSA
jgi:hypothetical protein